MLPPAEAVANGVNAADRVPIHLDSKARVSLMPFTKLRQSLSNSIVVSGVHPCLWSRAVRASVMGKWNLE